MPPKEKPGTIEHDFWQTIHAFEHVLSEQRGGTTRLARTRQKVARVGEVQTLQDWAMSAKSTEGFTMLLERNMPVLTGEAIVLRHARRFAAEVVAAAAGNGGRRYRRASTGLYGMTARKKTRGLQLPPVVAGDWRGEIVGAPGIISAKSSSRVCPASR